MVLISFFIKNSHDGQMACTVGVNKMHFSVGMLPSIVCSLGAWK